MSIIELLVVISIISLLSAVLVPALGKVRRQVKRVIGATNQKQITGTVTLYAFDNNDDFPESVATIGGSSSWNWQEPMMLTGYRARSPRLHRSMSAYLGGYIEDADAMYCCSAPKKYKYLQDSWDAGDEWDNPQTGPVKDPVSGTYCFYWNYTGYLTESGRLFRGPSGSDADGGESSLLVSDYFGFNHQRSRNSWASCEKFDRSSVTPGELLSSAYWSRAREPAEDIDAVNVKLNAGYVDGHVESYGSSDVVTMEVIWKRATSEPYPQGIGPGHFYLPKNAVR